MKKIGKKKAIITIVGAAVASIIGGIGVYNFLMNSSSQPMYGVPYGELSEEQKQTARNTFNAQFTQYTRTEYTNSQIKELINRIRVSNVINDAKGPIDEKYVIYTGPEANGLKENAKYTVKVKYNNEGYVCEVIVTENNESNRNTKNNETDILIPLYEEE